MHPVFLELLPVVLSCTESVFLQWQFRYRGGFPANSPPGLRDELRESGWKLRSCCAWQRLYTQSADVAGASCPAPHPLGHPSLPASRVLEEVRCVFLFSDEVFVYKHVLGDLMSMCSFPPFAYFLRALGWAVFKYLK